MNGKKAKRLRKHATQLLIRWIRSMTPEKVKNNPNATLEEILNEQS